MSLGRHYDQIGGTLIPVGMQVHPGVVDRLHVGKFHVHLSELCQFPEAWLE